MEKETKNFTPEKDQFLPKPNRQYKDTLFRMLFDSRKNLLELYNALHNTSYTNEQELEIVTLENAIYMNMKNDIAFLMADRLNMFEHQSTNNPNMPLRDLFYIAREYEKLVDGQSLYLSSKIKLPAPKFVVFYNGTKKCEEKQLLKLSDLYSAPEESPSLELTVTVLNINQGYNHKLTEQCKILREYVQYVEKVRHYIKEEPIRQAVDHAVTECIKEGILKDFLLKYREEAIQMSIFEYDAEKEIQLIRQDERQQGISIGIKLGIAQGITQGITEGITQGITQGEEKKLCELIAKKKAKGKTIEKIAAELEEDLETIQSLYASVE